MNKIGILGYGEIGRSIEEVYLMAPHQEYDIQITDLDRQGDFTNLSVLNICIPFKSEDQFVNAVNPILSRYSPELTIIHSTIAPGITQLLSDVTGKFIVHSPIRGVHPHLYEGIKTFVKFIGSDDKQASDLASSHFNNLGIQAVICRSSRTTELGKLLSTTYYGLVIAWHGEMKRICDEFGVSFEEAVSIFNETYNDGYRSLGREDVVRPALYPPEGGIGGHCIIPNVNILNSKSKSLAFDLINQYNKGE